MTTTIRPRGRGWQYDIIFRWPEGGRFRERANAPVASKSAAMRWAQAREAALLAAGKAAYLAAQAPPPAAADVPTLAEFWPRVLTDHYLAERKKPSTVDAAKTAFKVHIGPQLGGRRLDAIASADVASLKGALAAKRPKTVNNVLSVLSVALHAAVEWEVIAAVPCKITLLPVSEGPPDWYEREDYRRLVDGAAKVSTGHLVLVLLGGSAGLRRGEIRALRWTDVDIARRLIKVDRALWRAEENTPKGGRGRIVPMTPELAAALKAHRHMRGDRVLYSARGREMSNRSIRNWIKTAQRRAGLEVNGKVHMLRHTFCSHLAAAGVPAKAIQELAGHADLKTTMRYMHLAPGDRDAAMGALAGYYSGAALRPAAAERDPHSSVA